MDPDTLSGSIVASAPKLSHMAETFEQPSNSTGLTPAQCALLRASLGKARAEANRLIRQAEDITERVLTRRNPQSARVVQGGPQVDGSSRA